MKQKIYVTTDTHGCNEELKEALEIAGFDYNNDILIHIGDCTDRGPDSYGVIETLLSIKNLIAVRGNHDHYMLNFIKTGYHPWEHGSSKTLISYVNSLELPYPEVTIHYKYDGVVTNFKPEHMPQSHRDFFVNQLDYYIDSQNRLFVHGGYDPMEPIKSQHPSMLLWDRELVERQAYAWEMGGEADVYPDVNFFKRVFIGHTPTIIFKRKQRQELSPLWLPGDIACNTPLYLGQLVDLDTGCCFGGELSLIDITDDDNHILYQVKSKTQM